MLPTPPCEAHAWLRMFDLFLPRANEGNHALPQREASYARRHRTFTKALSTAASTKLNPEACRHSLAGRRLVYPKDLLVASSLSFNVASKDSHSRQSEFPHPGTRPQSDLI